MQTRYINHAASGSHGCNCEAKIDAARGLVWFEASRDITAGEELGFDYGPQYQWSSCERTSAVSPQASLSYT